MALLQLGNARGHGDLLEHRLHADLLGDGVHQVDFVADDLARLGVDEGGGLVGAEHADHEFALFLDVGELVRVGDGAQEEGGGG